jgi:hypothetical protein
MIALDPATHRRIIASARLTQSNHAGERAAAIEAVARLLPEGVSLADVLEHGVKELSEKSTAPEPVDLRESQPFRDYSPWRCKALAAFKHMAALNDKESRFVWNLATAHYKPSAKQLAWLDDITARLGVQ